MIRIFVNNNFVRPILSSKNNVLPWSWSAVGVRVARRRSLLGELQDVPDDCLQLDPLDVPGDNFRTARSHSMSTASCLQIVHQSYLSTILTRWRFTSRKNLSRISKNQFVENSSKLFEERARQESNWRDKFPPPNEGSSKLSVYLKLVRGGRSGWSGSVGERAETGVCARSLYSRNLTVGPHCRSSWTASSWLMGDNGAPSTATILSPGRIRPSLNAGSRTNALT